jgi:hypothetical protein
MTVEVFLIVLSLFAACGANPSCELDAEESEQKACNRGSYYPQQDIHEQPHVALHELLGEPSSDSADNDGCDPADLLIFHGVLRM